METTNTLIQQEQQYPSLVTRYKSYFIDIVFMIVIMFVTSDLIADSAPAPVRIGAFFIIWLMYEPFTSSIVGCTLGNYFTGIRVRKFSDPSQKINIIQAYARVILKYSLGYISFFTITGNKERRAIHDLVSGSVMISVENAN
ncbi:MAG: RDD family protein [Bacteroidetes bacterium]|nr:RDD family protein [Bacteroidota bacterium]MBS1683873.1 RDD family protein [Bacteroidota bacterium]